MIGIESVFRTVLMSDIKPIYYSAPILLLKQPQTSVLVLMFLMSRSA